MTKPKKAKDVESFVHDEASRPNIPTVELQSKAERIEKEQPFKPAVYERTEPLSQGEIRSRDTDLDPQIIWKGTTLRLDKQQIKNLKQGKSITLAEAQLTWRGKDQQDWSDLIVQAPPIYVQEKIDPKHIIEDLKRHGTQLRKDAGELPDLFHTFNGIDPNIATDFYQHEQNWQNRMILGDSLQVMASLAERENLQGRVQCIYFDPPYGIKFGSNWQVSTRSPSVKDGSKDHITREPEQVKAFRDTWKDGIHSYLTYLRDRLIIMREMLTDSGSIFVQISDENVHRVRALMDEVFGENNFVALIPFRKKTMPLGAKYLEQMDDFIIWYARKKNNTKYRPIFIEKNITDKKLWKERFDESNTSRLFRSKSLEPSGTMEAGMFSYSYQNKTFSHPKNGYGVTKQGMSRLDKSNRLIMSGNLLSYRLYFDDYPVSSLAIPWQDTVGADGKRYVVQTNTKVVQRCMLMTTDPGDLVFDPTCGSGTTATVAEQWGRRWITVDTSRVALALARTRMMAARYPYYYLADTEEGRQKEQKVSGKVQPSSPTYNDIRQGFVYERVPHITLKSIANNAEIDVIWERWQSTLGPLREQMNTSLSQKWEEWEIPRQASDDWDQQTRQHHEEWWQARIARQKEIDDSIAQKADIEYLYDRPYEDKSKVRVTGPFTVESLSPHRVIPSDESETLKDVHSLTDNPSQSFASVVIENLQSAGVHQSDKQDRIDFTSVEGWPGEYISAIGVYNQNDVSKRAGVFIGPEFGSVTEPDILEAASEASKSDFDILIICGFNFDVHTSEIKKLGPLPILKAKINPDLHMANDLKNTGAGNLFVVFGEPDIRWYYNDNRHIVVEILGIDVFDPKKSEVRSSGNEDIAAWFIDTDYNEESFFVRHAYFLGANDPYKSLKNSLKADINEEAWSSLYCDTSRPFVKPDSGRFAVKIINHFGDEVMKVFET